LELNYFANYIFNKQSVSLVVIVIGEPAKVFCDTAQVLYIIVVQLASY